MSKEIKPFVKWVGGKGKVLKDIEPNFPKEFGKEINKYVEPFLGGGAVLFNVLKNYNLKEIYISDMNGDLINLYINVRDNVDKLIKILDMFQTEFLVKDTDERKEYYYKKRDRFNELKIMDEKSFDLEKAALFIFLNKTCFNGLYRVNKKGLFNVPVGSYKNPLILDEENLRNVSDSLKNVRIKKCDYKQTLDFIDKNTFVYFDPPYRPLTKTGFTAYTNGDFNDSNQKELAEYVKILDKKGAKFLLSNSDPKNTNEDDDFFDNLYRDFTIKRIQVGRAINSNGNGRGKVNEILVKNF